MTNCLNSNRADSLEIILSHDGENWIAGDNGSQLRGPTLEDLDRALIRYLKKGRMFKDHVKVFMRFDMTSIPRWMHQYSGHYFNRTVTFSLQAGDQSNE